VNDVLATLTWSHALLKRWMRQPPAADPAEFAEVYGRTVGLLRATAGRVLAVSPLFLGEDLANPWNRALGDLCDAISTAVDPLDRVEYVDLRGRLAGRLPPGMHASSFLPTSVTKILCESVWLRSSAQVDRIAARRGLRLTLDGVHLNSTGAHAVAERLLPTLQSPG
jgi:lysophospholipase L1-like esterase